MESKIFSPQGCVHGYSETNTTKDATISTFANMDKFEK